MPRLWDGGFPERPGVLGLRSGAGDRRGLRALAVRLRALLACALLLGSACGERAPAAAPSVLPQTRIRVGNVDAQVEVAATPAVRKRGLMFREVLAADHGMLFIFPDERLRVFWMRNTRIPLSIAYADSGGRIVQIADMEPLSEGSVPSGVPARYALEMNRGWFARHGVRVGDTIRRIPAIEVE
ncbi:MAG: DUF192 domain-containing protein [Myxococcales bacterium]|nr:DUF192 domain-containing protein [Myxococcales bacterium]